MPTVSEFKEGLGLPVDPPRQYKRISLKKKVLLWPLQYLDQDPPSDRVYSGWTEIVGEGGLCLVTEMKVQVNQVLNIVQKSGRGHTPTLIQVQWISRMSCSQLRVGVKFLF